MAELSNDSKLNISYKYINGKSQTENAWGPEGEQVGIFFNIPSNVIFVDVIPFYPLDAISGGTAVKITADLTVDPASNGHAYFATWRSGEAWYPDNTSPGDLVKNCISPAYNDPFDTLGRNYNAIPYDTGNNFISETDARAWVYQYQSGVFYQQETNGTTPDHIDLYVYSGTYLSSTALDDLSDVTINNITLQNYNVLMFSGGTSGTTGGTWINFNIDDRYVNIEGDTMTGDLIMSHLSGDTLRSTYFGTGGTIMLGKDYSFSTTIQGNTNIDSFEKDLNYSCIWEYSIKSGSSMRTGTISSVWYSIDDSLVYNHTSTNDIGDTRDFTFDVLIISDQVKLNALTSGAWDIKIKRRFI